MGSFWKQFLRVIVCLIILAHVLTITSIHTVNRVDKNEVFEKAPLVLFILCCNKNYTGT